MMNISTFRLKQNGMLQIGTILLYCCMFSSTRVGTTFCHQKNVIKIFTRPI